VQPRASAEKFPGREGNGKKDRKIAKRPKIALSCLFQGGANGKKDRKIVKKDRKIILLSLYLPYLYYV